MQVPIEAPIEIKKKIAKKLQKSGALKKIERKIKLGMMVAVEEIKSEPNEKSHLERLPFKDATINETKALQCIYAYLAQHNMTYTLSTLLEESCVKRQQTTDYNLIDVIASANQDDYEEEEEVFTKPKSKSYKQRQFSDDSDDFDL